jgi:hypothetical protein
MTAMFVCADDTTVEVADDDAAIEMALGLAARHARGGIAHDREEAEHVAACALPGMVVCPRREKLRGVLISPLTTIAALVSRPRVAHVC